MFRSHRFWPLLCLIVLSMSVGVGCELFEGDDDDDDREADRVEQRIGTGVPREASRVGEGRGELSYAAKEDGAVYLYDATAQRVVDTQSVRKGQRYTVDPRRDLATVDGRPVFEQNLNPEHAHRLYFLSERDR